MFGLKVNIMKQLDLKSSWALLPFPSPVKEVKDIWKKENWMRKMLDLETPSTDKGSNDILNENRDWMDIYILNNK